MNNGSMSNGATGSGINGFFLGLVVGAAIAGAATLLYAPKSGQETRESLKAEIAATQEMFQSWVQEARERADNFSQIIRSSVKREMQTVGHREGQAVGDIDRQTG